MTLICEKFRAGLYVFVFASEYDARSFATRYATCPDWPIITLGPAPNEVFVVAVEPCAQQHGDFSEASNTLVKHPEYVGAVEVRFRRDDRLLTLFADYNPLTSDADRPPCGSDCTACPQYRDPCQGCPATKAYAAN